MANCLNDVARELHHRKKKCNLSSSEQRQVRDNRDKGMKQLQSEGSPDCGSSPNSIDLCNDENKKGTWI